MFRPSNISSAELERMQRARDATGARTQGRAGGPGDKSRGRPGDWECHCGDMNWGSRDNCFACGGPKCFEKIIRATDLPGRAYDKKTYEKDREYAKPPEKRSYEPRAAGDWDARGNPPRERSRSRGGRRDSRRRGRRRDSRRR